ncbi:MAG TPA: hypothetical protein VGG20_20210 [Thermoanaerobaculia bacterium]|jgi:hypothetical protein
MSTNRVSNRVSIVLVLLAVLVVLTGLPAGAQAARQPAHRFQAVAVFGDGGLAGIWKFFADLLPRGLRKEGMSIDPNGNPNHQGALVTPAGTLEDEGPSIDPNGRQ